MNKKILITLLLIPTVILTAWVGRIEFEYRNAPLVLVKATGYDPRDLISGHYLNLRLDWDKTDCTQFQDKQCPRDEFDWRYRFYLEEQSAMNLDRKIWRDNLDLDLEFAYISGKEPIIKELYINKKPWKEWVGENHE